VALAAHGRTEVFTHFGQGVLVRYATLHDTVTARPFDVASNHEWAAKRRLPGWQIQVKRLVYAIGKPYQGRAFSALTLDTGPAS
jgi:hypothetical protein